MINVSPDNHMEDHDIVQQFRSTKCYWWMRHTIEAIAVWLLDAAIFVFFYVLGVFLFWYLTLGIRVPIAIAYYYSIHPIPSLASTLSAIGCMGMTEIIVVLFVLPSPIFTVTMIWTKFHEFDQ